MEADRALTEARTVVGNLVRDLSQAAVDDLEHALGQAGNRSDDITRSLDRAGRALDGNPLQPSVTAAMTRAVPTGRIQIRAAAARRLFDADIGPLT